VLDLHRFFRTAIESSDPKYVYEVLKANKEMMEVRRMVLHAQMEDLDKQKLIHQFEVDTINIEMDGLTARMIELNKKYGNRL
jgi:hypothetical protein